MNDLAPLEEIPEIPETPDPVAPTSVADHAAQFGPQATKPEPVEETPAQAAARVRDEQGRFARERHRAKSQQASPEDVKVIGELTKELRDAEASLAKVRPSQGAESPRVLALRRQIRGLKAELEEAQPKPAETPRPQPAQPVQPRPQVSGAFTEAEPTLEQFADQPDQYAAWTRALARYDRRKEAFEAQQAAAQTQDQEAMHQQMLTYTSRVQEFAKTHPDFHQKHQAAMAQDPNVPPSLFLAVVGDDNGPALLYHLLEHPDQFDEMRLLAASMPPADSSVALLRRRLQSLSRSQAVATGSAVATPSHVIAPRPPNPVRTGPMKAGDDPPGDGHSVADHAKHWGPKTR